jgi:methionyl-tRNA formyltransferase
MNIAYFGNGPRGVRCLEEVLEHGYRVCAVVGHSVNSDVVQKAACLRIPAYFPQKVNSPDFVSQLQGVAPDLFVLSGYNQILHQPLIHMPPLGVLNLHGGKLPEYRGVAPINWQIIKGEMMGGCCIILVDEGIDTGDIVEQANYEIAEDDTAGDIVDKQLELFPPMLIRAIQGIETGSISPVKQDPEQGAYFIRRYPKDSRIHWSDMTAQAIHKLIRAMQGPSYPPAFSFYKGEKYSFHKSRMMRENIVGTPGRVALKRREGVVVIARDRGLLISRVSPPSSGGPKNPRHFLDTGEDLE